MKNIFWKKLNVLMPKTPFFIKMFLAKLLVRCLNNLSNDIVLFNELSLWIDTKGDPNNK